jgi:hypothetical protein
MQCSKRSIAVTLQNAKTQKKQESMPRQSSERGNQTCTDAYGKPKPPASRIRMMLRRIILVLYLGIDALQLLVLKTITRSPIILKE